MARTPLAARIMIDPAFSDSYESNHSGDLGGQNLGMADIQSPIDITSRTPTHIRFAEAEQNQLVEHPAAGRLIRDSESNSSQRISIRDQAEQTRWIAEYRFQNITALLQLARRLRIRQACRTRTNRSTT